MSRLLQLLWPTIESDDWEDDSPHRIARVREYVATETSEETLKIIHGELLSAYKEEEGRRARVEAKASSLLAAIGISVSLGSGILFAVLRAEFGSLTSKCIALGAMTLAVVGLLYLSSAAASALKALGRSTYNSVAPEDIASVRVNSPFGSNRHLAVQYAKCAIENRAVTNTKVDHVHIAQLRVLRALVVFVVMAVVSLAYAVVTPVKEESVPHAGGATAGPVASKKRHHAHKPSSHSP